MGGDGDGDDDSTSRGVADQREDVEEGPDALHSQLA